MARQKMLRLGVFREDPDNVSEATEEEIQRLAGKLKRVPLGLAAMRIAYVTDAPGGGCMVVSGNKRLRCLKAAYGEEGEVPAEWFQDITAMSEAERHEFRLNANISDGHFNIDKLLAQYGKEELSGAGLDALLEEVGKKPNQLYEGWDKHGGEDGMLAKKFGAPPFSVLFGCSAAWMQRKKAWRTLICDKGESRKGALTEGDVWARYNNGVSLLDPVLAELVCRWFVPEGGSAFDCFAGDSVFGYVAAKLGHSFTGIELREEQVAYNSARVDGMCARYICDDGQNVAKHIPAESQDLLFSCPPYYDLEVYSDKPNDASNQETYADFLGILRNAFTAALGCLKPNRFAVVVVGDVRDKRGFYYDFPGDIRRMFIENGARLYNDIVLVDTFGTAVVRANGSMRNRKVVKIHQNVLVFYKGDPKRIKGEFAEIEYDKEAAQGFLPSDAADEEEED